MATTKERNQSQKPKLFAQDKPNEVKELQVLLIEQLEAISGAGISVNHNEVVVKSLDQSQKSKPSSVKRSAEFKELQKLAISELEAIAGGALGTNHNETLVGFGKQSPSLN